MSAVHCPECGFANAEGANYCQKCGAYSVNPVQLQHNRALARSNRKAIIKEANRKSG